MTLEEFDRKRRLGQSLAGQASRHGVNAMGERLEYNPHDDPHEEEIWQETRGWLERSEEHRQDYNEREDANHWNLKALGYEAQQAVEHAMKGLLAAHDDQSRFPARPIQHCGTTSTGTSPGQVTRRPRKANQL